MKVGQVVGKWYRIDAQIGSGMSSTVWRATDTRTHKNVAIKALHPHLLAEPEYANRFRREGRIDVDHPNVVQVFDDGAEGDDVFIVMEYVAGGTLASLIEQGPMPPARAMAIVRDIAAALAAAHTKGITHRDVKPRNVLMAPDGRAKLSDFGIARLNESTTFTQTGIFLGTARYSAPEAFNGRAEHRSDLYSLGVILYELVTGRTPFESDTPLAIMQQHQSEQPPAIDDIARRDPRAGWIAERLLQKLPSDRFQSAQQLMQVLDGDATTVPLSHRRRRPVAGVGRRLSRGWRYVAVGVAGAALVAVAVALTLVLARGGSAPTSGAKNDARASGTPTLSAAERTYVSEVAAQQATATARVSAYYMHVATAEAGRKDSPQTEPPPGGGPNSSSSSGGAPSGGGAPGASSSPAGAQPAPTPPPPTPAPRLGGGGPTPDRPGDLCYFTPAGQPVDTNGCSDPQVDADADDVCERATSPGTPWCRGKDLCFYTVGGQPVDTNGCSDPQVDADGDNVCERATSPGTTNCSGVDRCFYTPAGQPVDANGCSASQVSARPSTGNPPLAI